MIKRDELADPSSCLNKALDEEPLFVLRANDERAPGIVRHWAQSYRYEKVRTRQWTDKAKAKYLEALDLADAMAAWKKEN